MTDKKPIPFDLERALAGDEVCYANGEEPEVFYPKNKDIIISVTQYGDIHHHDLDGDNKNQYIHPHLNLKMKPKTKTFWANIYKISKSLEVGKLYETEQRAKDHLSGGLVEFIKTIPIEIDESELL